MSSLRIIPISLLLINFTYVLICTQPSPFISPNNTYLSASLIALTTSQYFFYPFFYFICIIDNGLKRGSRTSHDKKLRIEFHMKVKTLLTNVLLAALYIAVSALIAPFRFINIQF